jgi:hypothetical protein
VAEAVEPSTTSRVAVTGRTNSETELSNHRLSPPLDGKQLLPSARQISVSLMRVLDGNRAIVVTFKNVDVVFVPVALVHVRPSAASGFVIVSDVKYPFVPYKFCTFTFVPVALTNERPLEKAKAPVDVPPAN